MKTRHVALSVTLISLGCGSPPAATPPPAPSAAAAPASAAPDASVTPAAPVASAAPAPDDDEVSAGAKAAAAASKPVAVNGVTTLEPLLAKGAPKADFPKKSASDKDCLQAASLSGKAAADFDAIAAKCGAPTGMKEYVKKVTGTLDAKHPRETYSVKMLGGFCYRFFAIGDHAIGDMDIRVQTPKGALVSMDQSKQAVAVLDPDEPWCKTHDREFQFVVESASGKPGAYVFGVYARPK